MESKSCIRCKLPGTIDQINNCNCNCHLVRGEDCEVKLTFEISRSRLVELGLNEEDIEYFQGGYSILMQEGAKGTGNFHADGISNFLELIIDKVYTVKKSLEQKKHTG